MKLNRGKLAGGVLVLGVTQFLLVMLVGASLVPGYSLSKNTISDLGVGTTASLYNTSAVVLGATLILAAPLLWTYFRARGVAAVMALAGIFIVGVGVFPETQGPIHILSATGAFLFGGVLAITSATIEEAPLNYFSIAMGMVGLAALALVAVQQYFGLGVGGMERMIAYPELLWLLAFGGHLISLRKKSRAKED